MKKINYKSDFDILASLMAFDGEGKVIEVGFANYDWELNLFTGSNECANRGYKVSYVGGKCTNCFNDGGKVHIVCDNHNLNAGVLNGLIKAYIPNPIYPDGHQLLVHPISFAVELVSGAGDTPSEVEVEILLPYLYDTVYRIAQQGGYKGTQEEYYQLASQLPNAVETAMKIQGSADSLAESAKQIGGNIADLQASVQSIDSAVEGINQGASTIKNSTDALQENADKVGASASAVEQAVEPLVQASESLDATKQAFEMLSSEWTDGRQAIATALTNRRYPTEPTESFHSMADKITNMNYEEGWFAKIGYTKDNDGGIQDAIDYSYELAKGWNPDGSTVQMFRGNKILKFFPQLDTSSATNMSNMFNSCSALTTIPQLDTSSVTNMSGMFYSCSALTTIPQFDTSSVTNMSNMFYGCSALTTIPQLDTSSATNISNMFNGCSALTTIPQLDTSSVTNMGNMFNGCSALTTIPQFDTSSVTNMSNMFYGCSALTYVLFKNIGKSSLTTYNFNGATNWGTINEENRQSLIDSLITYSYDRASNGMSTATITLSANTKALLTEEEIAQITSKGFTIA